MRNHEKLLKLYNKNPRKGVGAQLINGELQGVSLHNACYAVNVYDDGHMAVPVCSAYAMEDLKEHCPDLYHIAKVMANDFKILSCRENCGESLLFGEMYDMEAVDRMIASWEESSRFIVSLTDSEKKEFHEKFVGWDKDFREETVTAWMQEHLIPMLLRGKLIIDVDRDARKVTVETFRDEGIIFNKRSVYEYSADTQDNITVAISCISRLVNQVFGFPEEEVDG